MELRHVRYFVAVAEHLHFGQAARALHIAQPSLSRQIRDLEREIGVPLFERSRHRVQLTAAGFAFLEEARVLISRSDRSISLAREAAEGRIGTIRVGFSLSALGPALIESFRSFSARYPNLTIRAKMLSSRDQFAQLAADQIDVGFAHAFPASESPTGLGCTPVMSTRLVVAIARRHRLAERQAVLLTDLRGERLLVLSSDADSALSLQVRQLCSAVGYEPPVSQELDDEGALLALVGAGLGAAIVPHSWVTLNLSEVATLALEPATDVAVGFYRLAKNANPSLHAFLRVVEQVTESLEPLSSGVS
jgi:DNA-binding transcriptional LysR family regulator